MIDHLRIRNFKAWQDSGAVRLAPLTVLFGTNSAGKTSIPHLLLMLRQTVESPDRQRVLHLGGPSSAVDLGTYQDIVFRHELARPLGIEIGWRPPTPVAIDDPLSDLHLRSPSLRLETELRADRNRQPRVEEFAYRLAAKGRSVTVGMRRRPSGSKYDLVTEGYGALRRPGRPSPLPPPVHFHAFPDEAIAHYRNTGFLADLALHLQELMRSIQHVGPLREDPRRTYLWSGEQHAHVGPRGERAIEALLAAGDRRFNFRPRERHRSLQQLVAGHLESMGLIHDFEVRPIAEGRKEHEVLVRTHPALPRVALTDVGFGVSQVLPVIVECFVTPPGSIVIVEQPEIHLHPKVQSDLADVFIEAIRAREDGRPRNVQFIIESHSEHFLRRLQRRIAEESLRPDEAALYFVHADAEGARLAELEIDAFGNILNWPDDFFGDEMADLVARSEAQARRVARRAAQGGDG